MPAIPQQVIIQNVLISFKNNTLTMTPLVLAEKQQLDISETLHISFGSKLRDASVYHDLANGVITYADIFSDTIPQQVIIQNVLISFKNNTLTMTPLVLAEKQQLDISETLHISFGSKLRDASVYHDLADGAVTYADIFSDVYSAKVKSRY